jgi:hypothetical protein
MSTKYYTFEEVDLIINGVPIKEFAAEGTGIKVEYYEQDRFTSTVGIDGNVVVNKNLNAMGNIEVTLQQTSDSNPVLSALLNAAYDGIFSTFAASVTDINGNSLYTGAKCWLKSFPVSNFNKEVSPRVWVIDISKLITIVGNAAEV